MIEKYLFVLLGFISTDLIESLHLPIEGFLLRTLLCRQLISQLIGQLGQRSIGWSCLTIAC